MITENTAWEGGLCGVSAFGIGGSDVHTILLSNPQTKKKYREEMGGDSSGNRPYLVPFSGRTAEAVEYALNNLASRTALDKEEIGLIHQIFKSEIPNHSFRGYALLSPTTPNTKSCPEAEMEVEELTSFKKRPVWFIFSGMGTQWSGMGRELMEFGVFKESITKAATALKIYNFDLLNLILNGSEELFENVLNAFVSIVAIQVEPCANADTTQSHSLFGYS